jgi:hypothetical protein
MTLALESSDFYNLQDIELVVMPPYSVQQTQLTSFQERVTPQMLKATQEKRLLTRPQAERIVWEELEQEVRYLALNLKV